MISIQRVFVCVILVVSVAAAQQATSKTESRPEDAVVHTEEQWLRAFNEKDRKTLNELMPDDFMATTPIGEILGKSKLVPPDHSVQALPKYRVVAPVAHIYGDAAVLMARLADESGEIVSTTSVFKRSGKRWKIIATQLSPLPK